MRRKRTARPRSLGLMRQTRDAPGVGCTDSISLFSLSSTKYSRYRRADLVVIDEPELHLDPQWHWVLLKVLRKLLPNTQLIVATHSPEIYNSAKPAFMVVG